MKKPPVKQEPIISFPSHPEKCDVPPSKSFKNFVLAWDGDRVFAKFKSSCPKKVKFLITTAIDLCNYRGSDYFYIDPENIDAISDDLSEIIENTTGVMVENNIPITSEADTLDFSLLAPEPTKTKNLIKLSTNGKNTYFGILALRQLDKVIDAYKQSDYLEAFHWLAEATHSMSFGYHEDGCDKRKHDSKKAGDARRRASNQVKDFVLDQYKKGGGWKNKTKASCIIAPKALAESVRLGAHLTESNIKRKVYEWICDDVKHKN